MRTLRRLARLTRLLLHLGRGLLLAATRLPRQPPPRTRAHWRLIRWWHRRVLALCGIDLQVRGASIDGPVLFVANHVSWLDISALLTAIDAGFIGKHELRRWPLLGMIIARGGTIFIERGARNAAAAAAEEMVHRLEHGERAAVFPEGTTSAGRDVARFHPRLFDAAIRTGAPVQPVALRYNRAEIAFVDNEPFLRNLWRVLGETGLRIEVDLLPVIHPGGHSRRQLADQAHARIAEVVRHPGPAPAEAAQRL